MADATPFITLSLRFALVFLCFAAFTAYKREFQRLPLRAVGEAAITGILFHGMYLGGVFYAQSQGMSAGMSALIVSLHPIITAALAGPFLGERLGIKGWFGLFLGLGGAMLVLYDNVDGSIAYIAFGATLISLGAVTAGTLLQRKNRAEMPLSLNNTVQAAAATGFLVVVTSLIETPALTPTLPFTIAFLWQSLVVSLGAFTILMFLLKHGEAARTSALFFLVPPTSAALSWLILGEVMGWIDLIGLGIATFGVFLATRQAPNQAKPSSAHSSEKC